MQYFDVLSKTRQNLDYTKERGTQLEDFEYNQGVELWLFNNKKLLITQRSMEKSHPGEWETPGGCSQAGESSIDTLFREANEEVGLNLNEDDLQLVGTHLYKKQFVDVYKASKGVDESKITLQEEEVSGFKFVTQQEFMQMIENNEVVQSVAHRYFMFKDSIDKDW